MFCKILVLLVAAPSVFEWLFGANGEATTIPGIQAMNRETLACTVFDSLKTNVTRSAPHVEFGLTVSSSDRLRQICAPQAEKNCCGRGGEKLPLINQRDGGSS